MRALVLVLLLTACASRPLTETERAFSEQVLGPSLDASKVHIVRGAVVGLLTGTYAPRPRTSCRERIYPPINHPVTGHFPGFTVGSTLYYRRDLWLPNYIGQPLELDEAMMLAHELTHVWQWQNRRTTGYTPLKAAREHATSGDPYLTRFDPKRPFDDYTYEQQGVIVEEYVCCAALDPQGSRTKAIGAVLDRRFGRSGPQHFAPGRVHVPWAGVQTRGICG